MDIIPNHDRLTLHVAIKPDYLDEDICFQDLPIIAFRWASSDKIIPITVVGEPKSEWDWVIVLRNGVCRRDFLEPFQSVEHFDEDIHRLVKIEKDEWRAKGVKGRDEL